MIKYEKGDLFEFIKDGYDGVTMIPHVVNTYGLWASGFVVPVAKFMPEAKKKYNLMFDEDTDFHFIDAFHRNCPNIGLLGYNQYIESDDKKFFVVNMFAQLFGIDRPLRYNSLARCMDNLGERCKYADYASKNVRIVAPKFGSLRAGGNWDFIEKLIEDCWICEGIDTTIIEYKE